MDQTERELVGAAKAGDERAIEQILARYERPVYRFGLRMCGSEDAARDVLQQTLLTAFKGIRDFRGEASLSTWLYQIARSFCIKSRRRRVDEPASLEDLQSAEALAVPVGEAGPEEAAHARQIGEALQAAIQALPDHYREVLVLRDVEGLSAEEAAKVLGLEVANLKTRLHRARMEMRRHLAALLEPAPAGAECPELAERLSQYAAAEIEKSTCEEIERHMAGCPRCAGACDALKRTVSLCRNIPGEAVPAPVRTAVRQALLALSQGRAAARDERAPR